MRAYELPARPPAPVPPAAFWNEQVRDNTSDLRSYQNRYARAKRTSGNITLGATVNVWSNVDTGMDLTLNASDGDVIEYAVSGLLGNQGVEAFFDVVTVVSGSPVNSFGFGTTPANPPTSYGVVGWFHVASAQSGFIGSAFRTLVAGDISGGTVTLRLRHAPTANAARTLNAASSTPFEVWARNHGPVTT
jgi:hypothetical protein